MKLFLKITGGLLTVIILAIGGAIFYISNVLPNVSEPPELVVDQSAERIENGKYLANYVYACMDCHSDKSFDRFAPELVEGTEGKGGNLFGEEQGFPGNYYAKNITPYNLEDWTDGEIFRAITAGVNKDGQAMFPIMPYPNYARVDEDDIHDIIAYLRSLEPIKHDVPSSESLGPMKLIINTIPKDPTFSERPDASDKIAFGEYLAIAASCADCHTPIDDRGMQLEGMDYAGGMEFAVPGGTVYSANVTPHQETGIGAWTEEMFIARFKQFEDSTSLVNTNRVEPGAFNSEMPWRYYSKMSEEELSALFAYLQSLNPVEHSMTRFIAQTD